MREKRNKFSIECLKRAARHVIVALLFSAFSMMAVSAEIFKRTIETDLDSDGKIERIELNGEREPALEIWRGRNLLWQGVHARWEPWKMEIVDVDGDGKKEIVLGVFKRTKFFPKPHNCLFIYGFSGETAFPKWLGSSLSRPFTDFIFANLDNKAGDELVSLETTLGGEKSVGVYRWNGFGFTLDWQKGNWQTAKILGAEKGRILVETSGKQIFVWNDETR